MLNSKDTSGPAFPVKGFQTRAGQGFVNIEAQGMTLRDYFAAKAMQGLMGRNWSSHNGTDQELIDLWARSAYGVADAMMKARDFYA